MKVLKSSDTQTVCPALYSHSSTFALIRHEEPLCYFPPKKKKSPCTFQILLNKFG